MEDKKCFNPKCTQRIKFRCDCSPSEKYMCQDHLSDHVSIKGCVHNIQHISEIDPKKRESILFLLHEEISKINQLKKESLNIFAQLFLPLENLLKNIIRTLDMNLNEIGTKLDKVIEDENAANFETDQLLRSLLSEELAEVEIKGLFDIIIIG